MSTPASSCHFTASSTASSAMSSNACWLSWPALRLRSASSNQGGRAQEPTTVTGNSGSLDMLIPSNSAAARQPTAAPRAAGALASDNLSIVAVGGVGDLRVGEEARLAAGVQEHDGLVGADAAGPDLADQPGHRLGGIGRVEE